MRYKDDYEMGVCISFPSIIKSSIAENGDRLIEVQASSEDVDTEGDVILQEALMGGARDFIARGHLDIDHISELGHRYGVANPDSYIIGKPLDVVDKGRGHTYVKAKLFKNSNGEHNPSKYSYDMVWASLNTDPPAQWSASIFGYPKADAFFDCSEGLCEGTKATRYLVKGLDWRSLALTKNPINDSLTGFARIVKSDAFMKSRFPELSKKTSPCCEKLSEISKNMAAVIILKALARKYNKN